MVLSKSDYAWSPHLGSQPSYFPHHVQKGESVVLALSLGLPGWLKASSTPFLLGDEENNLARSLKRAEGWYISAEEGCSDAPYRGCRSSAWVISGGGNGSEVQYTHEVVFRSEDATDSAVVGQAADVTVAIAENIPPDVGQAEASADGEFVVMVMGADETDFDVAFVGVSPARARSDGSAGCTTSASPTPLPTTASSGNDSVHSTPGPLYVDQTAGFGILPPEGYLARKWLSLVQTLISTKAQLLPLTWPSESFPLLDRRWPSK